MPARPPLAIVQSLARRFGRACAGNVAGVVGIAAPVAVTLVLGATDVTAILNDRHRMRSIAEAAAISGARNLAVAMTEADALAHARAMAGGMIAEWSNGPRITVDAQVVELERRVKGVRVKLDARRPSFFNDLLPPGGWQYDIAATASSVGMSPLCVLAFTDRGAQDFRLANTARLTAPECLVHSNGNIIVAGGRISAQRTQAVLDARGDISPAPVTDAPPIADPFASLQFDANVLKCVGRLRTVALVVANRGTHSLPPGDHCGLIDLSGTAQLRLEPGEHRFGAGSMTVRGRAQLTGENVVLIVDSLWRTSLLDQSVVSLSGREEGLLAGFVMIADRTNRAPFVIDTARVERLDGVLYVPSAELRISSRGDVARQSDWTVIVARKLELTGNPNLFINANYDESDIEAPSGVGNRRGAVRLVE